MNDNGDAIVLRHVAYCAACNTYLPYWSTDEGDAWDLLREHQDEAHD